MGEPRKRIVESISYSNGLGVIGVGGTSGTVNVRRNRTEAETHAQIDRLIDMAGGLRAAENNSRLRSAAIRTWNALDATGRMENPLIPYGQATLVSRKRNNRR